MKKFSLKKSMAMVLALAMALALCVVPAFAADTQAYAPVSGTNTSFNKYLVMDSNANVPNVTFNYTIAPGAAIAAGATFAVSAGNDAAVTGTPTIAADQAAFSTADVKLDAVAQGDSVTLDAGESYVKKSVTIDFSGVRFSEPGVYRWMITEQETAGAMGMAYDTQKGADATSMQRVLDVYVIDNDGALEVASYVIHEKTDAPALGADKGTADVATALAKVNDKSDGYVNEYTSYDLSFSKAVSGNQASRDKVFAFTVVISGAVEGTKYDVDISGAQATSASNAATIEANAGKTNVTQLTVGADGSVTQVFYLTHGQSITIKGLAAGTKYSITENAEDYKPSTIWTKGGEPINGTTASVSETEGIASDASVAFTNTRNGMVPTGVALSLLPGIALIGVGGGFAVAASRKKKEDEE